MWLAVASAIFGGSACDQGETGATPFTSQRAAQRARQCPNQAPSLWERRAILERLLSKKFVPRQRPPGSVKVPVYFHILTSSDGTKGRVTKEAIRAQIKVLNDAFAGITPYGNETPTPFTFEVAGIEVKQNDAWFDISYEETPTAVEREVKALNKGGKGALNIYTANLSSKPFGWARWPWRYADGVDGIVIGYTTLPGGGQYYYDEGDTATHEVGHWLGLYHTFEGTCNSVGDEVEDTPPASSPAYGCPLQFESCPGDGRADSIHNFMNYTWDSCMYTFSPGQVQRMDDMHRDHRQ